MKNDLINIFFTKKEDGDMTKSENRQIFLKEHKLFDKSDIIMKQIHRDTILAVDDNYKTAECDGLITDRTDVALFVRIADCLPILFFDPIKNVIAVVHGGREGTFRNIVAKMIDVFSKKFNSYPENIFVTIGPGIGVCCYEVSKDMASFVKETFGKKFLIDIKINLKEITRSQLLDSGVIDKNITISNICTRCNNDEYFSYRHTGLKDNFAGIIALK